MKHLDPRDKNLWRLCRRILRYNAEVFGLKLRRVQVLSDQKDFFGDCSTDGCLRVQLRRLGTPLLAYQLIDTLAHELAHLKHHNHKWGWFKLHTEILWSMQAEGTYKKLRRIMKGKTT